MRSLLEWDYFNPYYFDQLKKLNRLESSQDNRDGKLKEISEKQNNIEQLSTSNKKSLEELNRIFTNLYRGKDEWNNNQYAKKEGIFLKSS